jgi:hypothetical protein
LPPQLRKSKPQKRLASTGPRNASASRASMAGDVETLPKAISKQT